MVSNPAAPHSQKGLAHDLDTVKKELDAATSLWSGASASIAKAGKDMVAAISKRFKATEASVATSVAKSAGTSVVSRVMKSLGDI